MQAQRTLTGLFVEYVDHLEHHLRKMLGRWEGGATGDGSYAEPAMMLNTGAVRNERTVAPLDRIGGSERTPA
jgi:hypothetical protein